MRRAKRISSVFVQYKYFSPGAVLAYMTQKTDREKRSGGFQREIDGEVYRGIHQWNTLLNSAEAKGGTNENRQLSTSVPCA